MSSPFCKYSGILGKPREGIHSFRIFDIAIVDVILTFVLAWFINLKLKTNYFIVLLFCFLLGILLHKLFCVKTKINIF